MKGSTGLTAIIRVAGLMAVAALPACGGGEHAAAPEVVIRGTDPMNAAPAAAAASPAPVAAPAAAADPRGVVDYGDYKVVIAQGGETVADLAQQVGLSAAELAAHNGLTPAHTMRAGDELVLPAQPGVPADSGTLLAAAEPAMTEMIVAAPVESAIETAPLSDAVTEADPVAPTEPEAVSGIVSDGEPADPTETGTPPWSPDLAAAAIERSSGANAGGRLAAPPSASEPIPPEPPARQELESPDLGQYQTGATGSPIPPAVPEVASVIAPVAGSAPSQSLALLRPVEGPVAVGFNKGSGSERNDGVDFAAPAGAPVIAAADGEVALVSPSLGGLGTIVLLRHSNGLLTVYGRIDQVTVQKGDIVQAGQRIGAVSNATPPAEPRLHFEVRRGAESLDPMQFL